MKAEAEAAPGDSDPAGGAEAHRVVAETSCGEESKLRAFWRITAVQQTAVLFVGSLAYDAGSVAYLVDLLTASVFFLLASGLFVIGLGLDLQEMRQTRAEARRTDAAVARLLYNSVSRRLVALGLNTSGGCVSLVASVYYLHASSAVNSFQGEEAELHLGDELFATGMWLFAAGTALLLLDLRYTVVTVSRARRVEVVGVKRDRALQVLAVYLLCLIIFGIASTLYILPDETSQTVGIALYVVSNISFTAINMVALYYLWMEHSDNWAAAAAADAAGGGDGDVGDGEQGDGDTQSQLGALPALPEDEVGGSPQLVELASVDVVSAPEDAGSPGQAWVPWSASPRERQSLEAASSPRQGSMDAHRGGHQLTSLTAMLLHNMEARQQSPAESLRAGHASPRVAPPQAGETPPAPGSLRLFRSRSLDGGTPRERRLSQ